MTDREIMQQALDALEYHTMQTRPISHTGKAIEALRTALAQPEQDPFKPDWVSYRQGVADGAAQPEQKPVAWYAKDNLEINDEVEVIWNSEMPKYAHVWIPLYTAPPRKEWVGLTDDDIENLWNGVQWSISDFVIPFTRAVEAKLREKNA